MCPFDLSSGTKQALVKDSYIALILMAPVTRHRDSLPRTNSLDHGDQEDVIHDHDEDSIENENSVEAVILNNHHDEDLDVRLNEILGMVQNQQNPNAHLLTSAIFQIFLFN